MQGTIVGVLRGGPSHEHEVSLKTGAAMISALPTERYTLRDIYIDKQGAWHDRGRPTTPDRALRSVDVVLNALHGEYGEDGEVQKLLDQFGTRYTGSDALASFFAMHKVLAKEKLRELGVRTPGYRLIESEEQIAPVVAEAVRSFLQPMVIKPIAWGSSQGVVIASGYDSAYAAAHNLLKEGARGVLIEEYVRGTEATVGIIENFRSEKLYALPVIEIIPPPRDFFSYNAKYSGLSQEIVPGRFHRKIKEELEEAARLAHQTLGLRDYSRSDFIVTPSGVYYLETNTLPGLTDQSLFTKALASVGVSLGDFLEHIVGLAKAR